MGSDVNWAGPYGQVYFESYRFDHERAPDVPSLDLGLGIQLNEGLNLEPASEDSVTRLALAARGGTDFQISNAGSFANAFGMLGARIAFTDTRSRERYGFGGALEAGYRFNSRATEHPYVSAEVLYHDPESGDGLVLGLMVNPVNFMGPNADTFDQGAVYFGYQAMF